MSEGSRLPHLQRPYYQTSEPAPTTTPAPLPKPVQREQKLQTETLPRPLNRQDNHLGVFTTIGQLPPSPDSLFSVKEQGLSNPKNLRFTMNSIPTEMSMCNNIGIPLGAVWQPLAELPQDDEQIQKIESPPFRCTRCLAYVNTFFKFTDSGRNCTCNICGLSLDIPEIYIRDRASKPELYAGTYDFIAPADYSNRPTQIPLFLFVVDVSAPALQLRIIHQVVASIRNILDSLPYPDKTLIGIITFDNSIQIYKIAANGELIEIVMTDLDDPFISESVSGCCYNAESDRDKFDALLYKLSEWSFPNANKQSLSAGGVIHAVKEYLLKSRGGRVLLFTSQTGSVGKHVIPPKQEFKPMHTEREKAYLPADNYLQLGQDCCSEDICVDIFACTHQTINSASLASLCSQTGGDFYYYPAFQAETDGEKLYYQIVRILTRPQGSQVVMRARCSNGLAIDYYIGKYKRKGPVEMEAACIDSDKSIAIIIKYDEKLKEATDFYVQCAMLYTTAQGQRLIRISNGKLFSTRSIPNILKSADVDTIANVVSRISAQNIFEIPLNTIRENWHNNIIKLLIAHRQSLGDNDFSKILVPDTLKLLPLYCNSALKQSGLTISITPMDQRINSIYNILSLPVYSSRLLLYPKIYSIGDIQNQSHQPGTFSDNSILILPRLVGDSHEFIKPDGVYLINNGEIIMIYIGKDASNEFIYNVWGFDGPQDLFNNVDYWPISDNGNEENEKVLNIIQDVRSRNPSVYASIYMFFEGLSKDDGVVKRMLVEDNNTSELAYGDFLMRVHKVVLNKISRND
ncbi:hypothetical protein SteCoe_22962 [Stentor coeruleus]|uniref:Uncharacterized protein n=1 Tax=Stentor coeruleus TaxID=5963 RepID=A0A1R2BKW9_9CILI|nr:hypothetical protein SteCoe_22962 [Stentor coeruleus]